MVLINTLWTPPLTLIFVAYLYIKTYSIIFGYYTTSDWIRVRTCRKSMHRWTRDKVYIDWKYNLWQNTYPMYDSTNTNESSGFNHYQTEMLWFLWIDIHTKYFIIYVCILYIKLQGTTRDFHNFIDHDYCLQILFSIKQSGNYMKSAILHET